MKKMIRYAYREAVTQGRFTHKVDDIWVYDDYNEALRDLQSDRKLYEVSPEYSVQVIAEDYFVASDGQVRIERYIITILTRHEE